MKCRSMNAPNFRSQARENTEVKSRVDRVAENKRMSLCICKNVIIKSVSALKTRQLLAFAL